MTTATHATADSMLSRGLALAEALVDAENATDMVAANEPSAEDLADFATWTDETTARGYLDQSANLTLDAVADHVAGFFKTWQNGAGDLFARTLEELAQKIRFTGAATPADFEARIEILDAEINEQREAIAYEEGRQHGRHEAGRLAAGYLD